MLGVKAECAPTHIPLILGAGIKGNHDDVRFMGAHALLALIWNLSMNVFVSISYDIANIRVCEYSGEYSYILINSSTNFFL